MNNIVNLTIANVSYKNSLIVYDYLKKQNIKIEKEIFKDIFNHENIFKELCTILTNKQIKDIEFIFLNKNKLTINKMTFLRGLYNYLLVQNHDYKKTQIILKIISMYSYKELVDYSKTIDFKIDNKQIKISTKDFIDFLEMSDDLLNTFLSNNEKYYHGIEIDKFLYALMTYFKDNDLVNKYIFNDSIIERLRKIRSMELIDYYSINKYLETKDPFLKDVEINDCLEKILFEDREKYSDLLEYIINTYLKLCRIFNYDIEYYIDNLSELGKKHTNIKNLYELDKNNSKLVCFEFVEIFGYFLNKLGINYELININGKDNLEYGAVHNILRFRYDKYCIELNPIKSIFKSDLTNVKVIKPLLGINCLNTNTNTVEEFQEKLNKIYKTINFDSNRLYLPRNKFNNSIELTPKMHLYIQKLDLALAEVREYDLENVDKISYLLSIVKQVFTTSELDVNIDSCIIREGSNLKILFCLNEISYMNLDNVYLVYDNDSFTFISKEDLQAKFDNKEYEYINEKTLPGIKTKIK